MVRLQTHLSYTERLLTLSFSGSTIFRQIKKNKERVNRDEIVTAAEVGTTN